MPLIRSAGIFLGLLLLLSQCTDTITEPNDNQEVNSFLPSEYGDVPLPGMDAENSEVSTSSDAMASKNGNKKYNSSTIALLKEYIAKHKKVRFAAAAGRWKPNKQKYKYKVLPLHFPDRMVQEADGEVIYYDYHLADTSRTVRKLQAIIPASREAAESMDEWLKMKGGKRIDPSEERTTGSSDSNPILSKKEECDREYVEGTCWGWYPDNYVGNPQKIGNFVYAYINGNGGVSSGDGYRYRGRGIFQLSQKNNYEAFTNFHQNQFNSTYNFIQNPSLISSDPESAIMSAMWFYKENVLDQITVNSNTTVVEITKIVNGNRTNGLNDREEKFNIIKNHIDDCNK